MKISIVHDKRRQSVTGENTGKFPIKIRLTYTREKKTTQKLYPTGCFATEDEFKKVSKNNTGKNVALQQIETKVYQLYENAKKLIQENPYVNEDTFGEALTNAGSFKDPITLMESFVKRLADEGRIGSSNVYRHAAVSFRKYDTHMSFGSITPQWLMKYEKSMLEQGRSITTVGMYVTILRTVFNHAKNILKLNPAMYPFGKKRYMIPSAKGRNLALTEEQKNEVLAYRTLAASVQKGIDFWIFSYFCYGMNFADIARLKFADIKGDVIIFDRHKTINTERKRSFIEIPIREEVWAIIKKWGNWTSSMNPNAYVFPFLRDGLTPHQVQRAVYNFTIRTNWALDTACTAMGLPVMTTYWARHTFATIAYKKGAGIDFIQMALGHADSQTTLAYIQRFDIEIKRKVVNFL